MSKFIIKAGPYGNEIVLGTITKELYEKYKDDSVALRKRVTTTGEPGDLNEWFDQRYLLINASNVDALDGQHGNLFVEPKPPKKK